jgi:hypothetical protein
VRTSIFAFVTDVRDEGPDTVLDNVQHRAGLGGLTVATAYHEGRDIFPHNPVRKVRFLESGAVFFEPDPARWRGIRLQPLVSSAADAFPGLVTAASRRGLELHSWTVFLHNGALAERFPDCAPQNAFGDPYLTELCPANPDVRAYARALASDVARLGVETIVAESLHYHPLEHGYSHERYFVPLGPRGRYLLGLCFCPHCLEAAGGAGIDGKELRRAVRDELEGLFAGANERPFQFEGELAGYTRVRQEVVTSLAAEVAEAARQGGATLAFMDLSGATKGYATGQPAGELAPEIAWQLGVDLKAVSSVCGAVEAIGYARDPGRLRIDLEAYRRVVGAGGLGVVLRPTLPDCDAPVNLREKVGLARELGLDRVSFYHYGLMRLDALDWIREAVTAKSA